MATIVYTEILIYNGESLVTRENELHIADDWGLQMATMEAGGNQHTELTLFRGEHDTPSMQECRLYFYPYDIYKVVVVEALDELTQIQVVYERDQFGLALKGTDYKGIVPQHNVMDVGINFVPKGARVARLFYPNRLDLEQLEGNLKKDYSGDPLFGLS
ncbi:MAG: hypothetical protein QY318_00615 [Candidatus Dojkabacteria bacterium]|nr:MAG: hypothetical protein QY318_00615 [Candidatus Dojkabacteria bacterium]